MLLQFITENIWPIAGLVVTVITIYVTMKQTLKSVEKDVAQIKVNIEAQRDKDAEHDIKFAEINGELEILKVEQKNLREYAINGIQRVEDAIRRLQEMLMSR